MILEITLLLATMVIATIACVLGKRFGVEYLIAMFTGAYVITNAIVSKLVSIGPFVTSAGIVTYSITFLITDAISEFWGKKEAQKAVWSGFIAIIMLMVVVHIAILMPPAGIWDGNEAFIKIFSNTWRVSLASLIAYLLAQSHDVWAFHFWKRVFKGKHLWIRNNFSTIISQVLDTIVFITIAFYGLFPIKGLIIGSIIIKAIIAVVDTPFLYLIRWYYEKKKPRWKRNKTAVPPVPGV